MYMVNFYLRKDIQEAVGFESSFNIQDALSDEINHQENGIHTCLLNEKLCISEQHRHGSAYTSIPGLVLV